MLVYSRCGYAICQHGVGKRSKVVGKYSMKIEANDVTHHNEAIKGSKGDIFDDIVENDNKDENGKIPYTIVTIKFASDYVKEQVTDQLEERIRERLLEQTKQA
ncbi:hypothetical protein GLOIN_2v1868166 [Rhizophagus irregularis DAOM 181602=DAOM 197198]|nr:hypothetical protein GLOIN_2v1868166 [Rhizophagus irregularis DAOM 181602=DAOM 197198]